VSLVAVRRQTVRFEWVWRGLLCVLLLFTGLAADNYRELERGTLEQLYSDLRLGRAEVVLYDYQERNGTYRLRVEWATGVFSWYQLFANGDMDGIDPKLAEEFPEQFAGPQGHTFREDLAAANIDGHARVKRLDPRGENRFWRASTYLGWWSAPALVVSGALLVLMLRTRRHRYANRWAWFWMFLAVPLGQIAYLLLERRPFPPERPPRASAPIGGFRGALCGFFVLPVLFTLFAYLFGLLPF